MPQGVAQLDQLCYIHWEGAIETSKARKSYSCLYFAEHSTQPEDVYSNPSRGMLTL